MSTTSLIGVIAGLVIGAIAGWVGSLIMKAGDFGRAGDIILGIMGGMAGGWLLPQAGVLIGGLIPGSIINAFIGACIVLLVLRPFVKAA
jgi:uncharacterized membrane protein YeaQ/YmgE (transglycosylase-associated protein family)